jgi:hypothetical protein
MSLRKTWSVVKAKKKKCRVVYCLPSTKRDGTNAFRQQSPVKHRTDFSVRDPKRHVPPPKCTDFSLRCNTSASGFSWTQFSFHTLHSKVINYVSEPKYGCTNCPQPMAAVHWGAQFRSCVQTPSDTLCVHVCLSVTLTISHSSTWQRMFL